jgi:hypothetical protein
MWESFSFVSRIKVCLRTILNLKNYSVILTSITSSFKVNASLITLSEACECK